MYRFAVLGAGNGGQAIAAHLAARGMDVILFNRRVERLEPLLAAGTLRVSGAVEATVPVTLHRTGKEKTHGTRAGSRANTRCGVVWVTDRVEEAAKADVLMVTVPATAHAELGRLLAPHVREGQVIVLNPGRTLGALEMEMALQGRDGRDDGPTRDGAWPDGGRLRGRMGSGRGPTVAEAQSLLYAARVVGPAHVHVFSIKRWVVLAALPAWRTRLVLDRIRGVFPQFQAAPSVLHTSLDNIGAIFHPAPVLLNLARVEAGESFDHYHQGMTPAVVRVLEAADEERLAVARALGVEIPSAREWLSLAYRAAGEDLYRALQGNTAYTGIKAPSDLNTRYLWEDVPTGLVPLASLGEAAGVPTPTLNSLIHLASLVHGIDYLHHGRTLRNMGLSDISCGGVDFLRTYVLEGGEAA